MSSQNLVYWSKLTKVIFSQQLPKLNFEKIDVISDVIKLYFAQMNFFKGQS